MIDLPATDQAAEIARLTAENAMLRSMLRGIGDIAWDALNADVHPSPADDAQPPALELT